MTHATPRRTGVLLPLLIDLGLPLAVYYGLRSAGVDQWWSLLWSAAAPAVTVVVRLVRTRRVDFTALLVLSMIVLGLVLSVLTGDPRTLLIREAWTGMLGGLLGVWLLASVGYGRPALMVVFRNFVRAKAGEEGLRAWEARWEQDAAFRRGVRVLTAVWGAASLLNALAQLAFAYLLPVDTRPGGHEPELAGDRRAAAPVPPRVHQAPRPAGLTGTDRAMTAETAVTAAPVAAPESTEPAAAPDRLRLFAEPNLDLQTRAALGATAYRAAEVGEVLAAVDRVNRAGLSGRSYHEEFLALDRRTATGAEDALRSGRTADARDAYLRAAKYLSLALFSVLASARPADEPAVFAEMRACWHRAGDLLDPPVQRLRIPYEDIGLPAYLLTPPGRPERRPTLVLVNGSDAQSIDLYCFGARAAVERGWNALVLEGPGQGSLLFEHGIPFRPDWEHVVRPVVDHLLSDPSVSPLVDPDRIALTGWSMSGILAIRAAAFEPRLAAVVADPGAVDNWLAWPEVWRRLVDGPDRSDPEAVNRHWRRAVLPELGPATPLLAKRAEIFGTRFLHDARAGRAPQDFWQLARTIRRFRCDDVAHLVTCPTLVLGYEAEALVPGQDTRLYDLLRCPKQHTVLTAAQGAGDHCAPMAPQLRNAVVLDWLERTLA
ncbi:VC0807 family protein [Kitasatospora sp. NPDC004799]|uniref:VC0807 family protein n=1 Tax=Kitasatospora sp. NPDC004799 TaxID=3154460 RepID=UPI0033A8E990